jgi:hypothetical protein
MDVTKTFPETIPTAEALTRLGFKTNPEGVTRLSSRFSHVHHRVGDVVFSVRAPRGTMYNVTSLVFEVNARSYGRRVLNDGECRVKLSDTGWEKKVADWIKAALPKAAADEVRRREVHDRGQLLNKQMYEINNTLRDLLEKRGVNPSSVQVFHDGTKITGARIQVCVLGNNAEEIMERLDVVLNAASTETSQ